ncbi:MAG: alkyl sulfatase C-terminal domain-containing protein, partial [Desulfomonilaceae bacterium]
CNPATLTPLSPRDSAPLYVEMMGGAEKIIAKGKELHDQGKYRHAQEILNKLVYAEPTNQDAKDLLADVFEQIGYQKESPSLRNSFLAAACELRSGIANIPVKSSSPDTIRAISTDLWLDFLGIMIDSRKAEGINFIMNLVHPDIDEKYVVEISNATLTSAKGFQAKSPNLTLTINRSDLETVMMGNSSFTEQLRAGKAKLDGNPEPLMQLMSILVQFTPDFEIMPGTKGQRP